MKKSKYIHWKIWVALAIIALALITSLNWVLSLPAVMTIIGDEKTWLPIVVDIILTILLIVIGSLQQQKHTAEQQRLVEEGNEKIKKRESLKTQITKKKASYSKLDEIINSHLATLSFNNKFKALLVEYNPISENCTLTSKFVNYKNEIEMQLLIFDRFCKSEQIGKQTLYDIYRIALNENIKAYVTVLDSGVGYFNKSNRGHTKIAQCDTLSSIADKNDEINIGIKKAMTYQQNDKNKDYFLELLESQKEQLEFLYNGLPDLSHLLLKSEMSKIDNLETQLTEI